MRDLLLVSFLSAMALGACTKTSFRPVSTPLPEQRAIIAPATNRSAVGSILDYKNGVLRGTLEYTNQCRFAMARRTRTVTMMTRTPNRRAGFGAIVPGAVISAISLGLLTSLDTFSDNDDCTGSDTPPCLSTRDHVTGWSVVSLGAGAALVTTGLVTQFLPTRTEAIHSVDSAPEVTQVLERGAPCGEGPARGFDLVLKLDGELELGKTVTNESGQFAFVVPANVVGRLGVYVENPSVEGTLVAKGTFVESFDYPPTNVTAPESVTAPPKDAAPESVTAPPQTQ